MGGETGVPAGRPVVSLFISLQKEGLLSLCIRVVSEAKPEAGSNRSLGLGVWPVPARILL